MINFQQETKSKNYFFIILWWSNLTTTTTTTKKTNLIQPVNLAKKRVKFSHIRTKLKKLLE